MIFVDTGPFLARYNRRDSFHEECRTLWDKLTKKQPPLVTSNFVIDEVLTLLGRRAGYGFAAETGRVLYASKALRVLRPDERDEHRALSLFQKLADQQVSFTDCVSFALMERHRVEQAFTLDRHFAVAGFRRFA